MVRFRQAIADAQKAVEADNNNIKAHLLMGECLCMAAKTKKDVSKIDTAITRMTKGRIGFEAALTLCSSQDMRKYEIDIVVCIRKAKKLKWMMGMNELELKRNSIIKQVEVMESDVRVSFHESPRSKSLPSTLKSSKIS